MKTYRVTSCEEYDDQGRRVDPRNPGPTAYVGTSLVRAHSPEGAEERFYDLNPDMGWIVVKVERVKGGRHA